MNQAVRLIREENAKKNKSEEFRDMIRAARNFGKEDAEPTANKKARNKRGSTQELDNDESAPQSKRNIKEAHEEDEEEEEKNDDKNSKKTFLKRKSKNLGFQKVEIFLKSNSKAYFDS